MNPNMRNEKLRGVFEGLGLTNVKTVISSGNVLFESPREDVPALEAEIEDALWQQLGFHSATIIRSREELQQLVDANPFEGYIHNRSSYLLVTFLKHQPEQSGPPPWPSDRPYRIIAAFDREIYTVTDTTAAKAPDVMAQLEKWYGKDITSRIWKTVERMLKTMALRK
jgi:uncharacterized protein (DUF1697 family)